MARSFGQYSPVVPQSVDWEETIQLVDENGDPIDITGYDVRAQFYVNKPIRNALTGKATVPPIVEITSAGYYLSPPGWTVIEGASIPDGTDGTLLSHVEVADLWQFSPTNLKSKYYWSILLVNPDTLYAIPVVQGRPTFKPAITI